MSARRALPSLVFIIALILALISVALYLYSINDRSTRHPVNLTGLEVPKFTHTEINFVPTYNKNLTLPFTAGAVIDINNDGIEELFFGGGINQQDAFFQFNPTAGENGQFENITAQTGWSKSTPDKTFSAISLDFDNDTHTDMLVTRQSGIYLYRNNSGRFTGKKLPLDLDKKTVPLSVTVTDLNRDGLFDMYVSGYIARRYVEGETIFNQTYGGVSALFINAGNDIFKNITKEAGLYYQHNTFQSVFIDVDNDNLEDLVVAHDTGQVRTWKNLGNSTFRNMPNPSTDIFAYPMGISIADINNDGLPDFFFSNVGSTIPAALIRGDLTKDQTLRTNWFMFENKGNFEFSDATVDRHLAEYGFAWGSVFEDFNLDGRNDLVVAENYVGWPVHQLSALRLNSRFLLQADNGKFVETGKASKVKNRFYGITPLTADFNQDGYPDLVFVNLLGEQQVYLSVAGKQNHLKVKLPNTIESVGAKVTVTLESGKQLVQFFVVGEGLASDQSHVLVFGLGPEAATTIEVERLNEQQIQLQGSFRNQLVEI